MAMNTVTPRHDEVSQEFRELGLTFECATRVSLAYIFAFALAMFDYVERTTGRTDYEDFAPMWPKDEVAQQIWRAPSTRDRVRKFADDADLMRRLRDIPALVSVAEDYARQLLLLCR
jgi:hypothetical protein